MKCPPAPKYDGTFGGAEKALAAVGAKLFELTQRLPPILAPVVREAYKRNTHQSLALDCPITEEGVGHWRKNWFVKKPGGEEVRLELGRNGGRLGVIEEEQRLHFSSTKLLALFPDERVQIDGAHRLLFHELLSNDSGLYRHARCLVSC